MSEVLIQVLTLNPLNLRLSDFQFRGSSVLTRFLFLLFMAGILISGKAFGANILAQDGRNRSVPRQSVSVQGSYSAAFSNTIAQTTAIITNSMAEKNVQGLSIALVEGTNIVWSQGFGYADTDNGTPAAPDTVYMLGSISKTLVTALLMDQYDSGMVSLDASVTNYIPELSMLPRFSGGLSGVTVRRLLNHHSGIPGDIMNDIFVTGAYRSGWEDWLIAYLQSDYPAYAPGQIVSYCNSAFVLVGEIVERTAGTNLNDYISTALFEPLDMNTTSFTMITNNLSMGYVQGEPTAAFNSRAPATGGAFTTVEDMAQFIMMMIGAGTHPNGARIMQSNTLYQVMGSAEISPLDFNSYFIPGLGLDSVDDPVMRYAGRTWMKDGSTENFNTLMEVLPDQKLGVILMANSDTSDLLKYHLVRQCLKLAVSENGGPAPSEPAIPDVVSITNAAEITGKYVTSGGYDEIAANEDGTLTWTHNSQCSPTEITLVPTNSAYMMEGYDAKYVFTNVSFNSSNYLVMVQYGSTGSEGEEYMYGSYVVSLRGTAFEPAPITEAWSNRINKTCVVNNIAYDEVSRIYTLSITETNGVLLLNDSESIYVINPVSTNLAFRPGLSSRSDSCVRFVVTNDSEQIVFGGYIGMDISLVPDLTVNSLTNGSVQYHKNDWYRFTPEPDIEYIFRISTSASTNRIIMRLLDEELSGAITNAENTLRWTSTNSSPVYLALAPASDAEYTLGVYLRNTRNDYDGDGVSDLAVFDNSGAGWYVMSMNGSVPAFNAQWGWPDAMIVPGDYDGDGVNDLAVFDASGGYWYIISLDGSLISWHVQWGWSGVLPVPGDYDGDGASDLAVFDGNSGDWFILSVEGSVIAMQAQWGLAGTVPVSGDYDGDGIDDLAVFNDATGEWYIKSLADSALIAWAVQWGWSGVLPVPGDYDGDGADDLALFDSDSGEWYISTVGGTPLALAFAWGWQGAVPVPGDYNGDGASDLAVFDASSGYWYICSLSGDVLAWEISWGGPGTIPVGYAH